MHKRHDAVHEVVGIDAVCSEARVPLLTVDVELDRFEVAELVGLGPKRRFAVAVVLEETLTGIMGKRLTSLTDPFSKSGLETSSGGDFLVVADRDKKAGNWVQEGEVDGSGLRSIRVADVSGVVREQLHKTNVLLVHQRSRFGARHVNVVAAELWLRLENEIRSFEARDSGISTLGMDHAAQLI